MHGAVASACAVLSWLGPNEPDKFERCLQLVSSPTMSHPSPSPRDETMRSILLLLMSLLPQLGHATQPGAIAPGMSPQEVIAVLGAPDRIAVFAGKYLRDVPLAAAASAPEGKFVFVYRD